MVTLLKSVPSKHESRPLATRRCIHMTFREILKMPAVFSA
jgi:hypothetical protein